MIINLILLLIFLDQSMYFNLKKLYNKLEGLFSIIFRVCKKDGNILLMNQGLSGIVEFHYWQNAIAGQKLYNMGVFTNRNW